MPFGGPLPLPPPPSGPEPAAPLAAPATPGPSTPAPTTPAPKGHLFLAAETRAREAATALAHAGATPGSLATSRHNNTDATAPAPTPTKSPLPPAQVAVHSLAPGPRHANRLLWRL